MCQNRVLPATLPRGSGFGAAVSSSPLERLCDSAEEVASPFRRAGDKRKGAGHPQDRRGGTVGETCNQMTGAKNS